MAQETRKDPRAKVLTMTVRYKSATLDEFIEHHSHDVSRGGMFIKTPSPFPPGTLLKFEVKIAEDQKVIQGVGRVVWKREGETTDRERPSGMGVKFIKIDDASRKTIDQLVTTRGDAGAAYEAGGGDGGSKTVPSATPAAALSPGTLTEPAGKAPRKATMIGLGSMGAHAAKAAAEPTPAPPAASGSFFPISDSAADMPPPEDRTVMKQAAELLQDALREAGGSLDDVGSKSEPKKAETGSKKADAESAPVVAPKSESDKGPHTLRSEPPKTEKKTELKPASARPAAAARSAVPAERTGAAKATSTRPKPLITEAAPASDGGGGRTLIILGAIAAVAAALFFLTKKDPAPPEPEPPAAVQAPAPVVTPPAPPTEEAKPAEAPSAAAPAETASAAPSVSAAPSAAAAPSASAAAAPSAKAFVPVTPAPVVARPAAPKPKPKPAAPVVDSAPGAEPAPTPTPTAAPTPAPTVEPKPAEPAPTAAPAPAPKPKPADSSGDNPY
jgi:uncharacterized protein (TIGR02266 family)